MAKSVCVDASLIVNWLLPEPNSVSAAALLQKWADEGVQLVTAPLSHAELTSVLRKQVYFKKLLPTEGEAAFQLYNASQIKSFDDHSLPETAWELAKKFNLPCTYDMQYLAVAELMNCELWTCDKRLVNCLQGKCPRVKLLEDYQTSHYG